MLPARLCILDDDADYSQSLSRYLASEGIAATAYLDGDEFLTGQAAFEFDFYLIDLILPGIDGRDVIRLLRRRSEAGIIAVSARIGAGVLGDALSAGADMYLAKPVEFEQILLAVRAVARRTLVPAAPAPIWRLNSVANSLKSPHGVHIKLSELDVSVLQCFVESQGGTVSRATICERLGYEPSANSENLLHAAIYRLRKRIERAIDGVAPLQSVQRVGYVFRNKLFDA